MLTKYIEEIKSKCNLELTKEQENIILKILAGIGLDASMDSSLREDCVDILERIIDERRELFVKLSEI